MTLSFGDRTVEAVLYDLDDVLVPFQTVHAWQWAWRPQGPVLGERRVTSVLRTRLKAWDRRRWQGLTGHAPPAGLADLHDHLRQTLRAIAGRELPEEESTAVLRRFLRPASEIERYPEALRSIDAMTALGLRVGIVTYLPTETALWLLRRVGVPERLLVGSSEAEAPTVPTVAAFRAAAERLGTTTGHTVYVGDLLWSDVRAAGRAGCLAFLLDRHDAWPNVQTERTPELLALEATIRAGPTPVGPEPPAPS